MVLRRPDLRERRGAIAAEMVHAFSPLALVMGAVLATFGATLTLREIERPDQLWSTAYGRTLVLKLLVAALVFSLGAWNWRRQRPKLGTELAARSLRGSATGELMVAMVVIAITAVLAGLPSPTRRPPEPGDAARVSIQPRSLASRVTRSRNASRLIASSWP
jgi:copper transport protein